MSNINNDNNSVYYVSNRKLIEDTDKAIASVTASNVKLLMELCNYEYVSHFQRLSEFGVINPIFFIKVMKNGKEEELVLRVRNPHPYWKTRTTLNEARIIFWLKKHSSIPLPSIIAFSDNNHTTIHANYNSTTATTNNNINNNNLNITFKIIENNPFGCEFVLSEKIKGIVFERITRNKKISKEVKKEWARKVLKYVKELHEPSLYTKLTKQYPNTMGMFTTLKTDNYINFNNTNNNSNNSSNNINKNNDNQITNNNNIYNNDYDDLNLMHPGPMMWDGPPIGPFNSLEEFIRRTVNWGIQMIRTLPHLKDYQVE